MQKKNYLSEKLTKNVHENCNCINFWYLLAPPSNWVAPWLAVHRSTWSSSATRWMTSQQGATFGHHPRLNSWFLDIGRSDPVVEVSQSPHHSCGIYFLPTSGFSTMNINFSGRDLKLIICNSLFCATEDLCRQCELYYYYYYYWKWDGKNQVRKSFEIDPEKYKCKTNCYWTLNCSI